MDTDATSRTLRHVVMCSTELDPGRAIVKIVREIAASRIALDHAGPAPGDVDDFTSVMHGALYMGHPDRSGEFEFLLADDRPKRHFSELPNLEASNPEASLEGVVKRLHAAGCDVLSADLTTVEAESVGLTVVRVIIPQLMPLSFAHRARFLEHHRLYAASIDPSQSTFQECDVNPLPQPFA